MNHLMQVRRDKLKELQEEGKDPYQITKFDRTQTAGEIKSNYEKYEQKDVTVAGRIIAKRIMGKASFCTIQDSDEKIQSYVSINDLGEESYKAFKTYDIGDFIGITGFVFKTRTEEISVHAKEVTLLSKSLRPLPEKFHGLKDVDLRYRQRYVDGPFSRTRTRQSPKSTYPDKQNRRNTANPEINILSRFSRRTIDVQTGATGIVPVREKHPFSQTRTVISVLVPTSND